jgi:hypothetical protein
MHLLQMTNVESNLKSCWEITGCNTKPGAGVGTGYGCKGLPKLKPGQGCGTNLCACNGAWSLNKNNTVSSVMDGQCLQTTGAHINVGPCVAGVKNQIFEFIAIKQKGSISSDEAPVTKYSVQQGDLCVDNNKLPSPTPAPPPPGGPADVTIDLAKLNLDISGEVRVRDVWAKKDLPNMPSATSTFKLSNPVPYHGSAFIIFMPAKSEWPLPFELAPWMKTSVGGSKKRSGEAKTTEEG